MARKSIVVIKSMNAYNHATKPFGPGNVVAVIPDARDIGVQMYANDSGSMYFTLPVDHPALPLIDPIRQHYVVQRWDGSQYVDVQGGVITDYDAGENEVVISGVDYMTVANKYYTPLPGPKIGSKAIPNTDETDLGHYSTSNYTANALDTGNNVYGRAFGDTERNFPIDSSNLGSLSGSARTYVNLSVDPYPNSSTLVHTPKTIIEHAVKMDKEVAENGRPSAVPETNDHKNGSIRVYSGSPQTSTTPTGKQGEIIVDYEEVSGVRTGNVSIKGSLFVFRGTGIGAPPYTTADIPYSFYESSTNMNVSQRFTVRAVGFLIYTQPGGPLYVVQEPVSYTGTDDIGITASSLEFNITLRPVNHYDPDDEQAYGLSRKVSLLTEGVSYSFAVRPFYIGNFTILDIDGEITPTNYDQYIWGEVSKFSDTGVTSGLKSNTLNNIFSSTYTEVMDRSKDYEIIKQAITSASFVVSSGDDGTTTVVLPNAVSSGVYIGDTITLSETSQNSINNADSHVVATISSDRKTVTLTSTGVSTSNRTGTGGYLNKSNPALVPIIKFTSLNQVNTASSTTKHPYATAGQGPIDFFRETAEIEMGTRTDGSKTVFNFYGVPGATPTGDQLIVNHNVSATPQATLIFPGQIRSYSVVNRRSVKVNSVRVIPTTEFLLGASTEGATNGVRSQGVIKNSQYLVSDPALPVVATQGGFISSDSASNYGQGIVNDRGTDSDVTDIRVELRSEIFGPIGVSGTPKLGETVKVVINRKNTTVNGDMIIENYNVGGMEWMCSITGEERLYLDLVKPNKFVGPGITWDSKPAPEPEKTDFVANKNVPRPKKKEPRGDGFPVSTMGPGEDAGAIYNQSWWGPGGWQNIGGANDRFNIQQGRGGAYSHASYVISTGWKKPKSTTGLPKNWWKKLTPMGK